MSTDLKSIIEQVTTSSTATEWDEEDKRNLYHCIIRKNTKVLDCFLAMCNQEQSSQVLNAIKNTHVIYQKVYEDEGDIIEVNCSCGEECTKLYQYVSQYN